MRSIQDLAILALFYDTCTTGGLDGFVIPKYPHIHTYTHAHAHTHPTTELVLLINEIPFASLKF